MEFAPKLIYLQNNVENCDTAAGDWYGNYDNCRLCCESRARWGRRSRTGAGCQVAQPPGNAVEARVGSTVQLYKASVVRALVIVVINVSVSSALLCLNLSSALPHRSPNRDVTALLATCNACHLLFLIICNRRLDNGGKCARLSPTSPCKKFPWILSVATQEKCMVNCCGVRAKSMSA